MATVVQLAAWRDRGTPPPPPPIIATAPAPPFRPTRPVVRQPMPPMWPAVTRLLGCIVAYGIALWAVAYGMTELAEAVKG